jgi:hypothetical protein
MATVKIFEGKVRIESTLTNETIKKAKAFEEDSLCLKDKDGDAVFCVDSSEHTSVTSYGVELNNGKALTCYEVGADGKLSNEDSYKIMGIVDKLTKVEKQIEALRFPEVNIEYLGQEEPSND